MRLSLATLIIAVVAIAVVTFYHAEEQQELTHKWETAEIALHVCRMNVKETQVDGFLIREGSQFLKSGWEECEVRERVILETIKDDELYNKVEEALAIHVGMPPGK